MFATPNGVHLLTTLYSLLYHRASVPLVLAFTISFSYCPLLLFWIVLKKYWQDLELKIISYLPIEAK